MTDRRRWPANDRVAHVRLGGQVAGVALVEPDLKSVVRPVVDLCAQPNGPVDRQMLAGDSFAVLEERDGWAFGEANFGAYVGWVEAVALGPYFDPTHWITTRRALGFAKQDMKSGAVQALPLGAGLRAEDQSSGFTLANGAWFPDQHLSAWNQRPSDFVTQAELCLGAPYLWGGDSPLGIDCSGLVALALRCTGQDVARDSDQQAGELGCLIATDDALRRGDLVFWKGHVGIMQSETHLIHANAHHMAVVSEPLARVVERCETGDTGPITMRRRVGQS